MFLSSTVFPICCGIDMRLTLLDKYENKREINKIKKIETGLGQLLSVKNELIKEHKDRLYMWSHLLRLINYANG